MSAMELDACLKMIRTRDARIAQLELAILDLTYSDRGGIFTSIKGDCDVSERHPIIRELHGKEGAA